MAKPNRVCKVCGKAYFFCPNCDENYAYPKPSWFGMFESEQCKDIFNLLTKYFFKDVTPSEARKILDTFDLTDITSYDEDIQAQIKEIYDLTSATENVESNTDIYQNKKDYSYVKKNKK